MGSAAAQMLGELIEGLPLRSSRVELSTELIVRESTAARQDRVRLPRQSRTRAARDRKPRARDPTDVETWRDPARRPTSGSPTCSAG